MQQLFDFKGRLGLYELLKWHGILPLIETADEKEGAQGMDSIEIDVALYRGSHRLTQAELFELKKSNPSKEELDKYTVKLTQRTLK